MPFICLILCLLSIALQAQDGFVEGKPKIAYWKIGNKEDIVVVIHGGPGVTHDYLRPEWDRLAEFATVVYYDQRGNGSSEKAECYSWKEHVHDLNKLIELISPNQQVILAGSSWGVELALLFAHTNPDVVKGIILTGTVRWRGGGHKEQNCDEYTYQEITDEDKASIEADLLALANGTDISRQFNKSSMLTDKERAVIEAKNIQGSKKVQFKTINSLADAPRFDELQLDVPIIIFQGTDPCHFPDVSNQYANISPHSEVVYVRESCHDPWVVNPDMFFNRCGKFIEKNNRR